MSDAEKIQYLIDSLRVTASGFATSIGLRRAAGVYNIINKRYKISPDFAHRVVAVYTNVNIDWLLRNAEEPYLWGTLPIAEKKPNVTGNAQIQDTPEDIDGAKKVAELENRVSELLRDKRNYESWVVDLRRQIEGQAKIIDALLEDKQRLMGEVNALKNKDNDEAKSRVC